CFFATGALIPIIPFIFGMDVLPGAIVAIVLVSLALMTTGGITGLISGKPPLLRALRQLDIGLGAAGITYLLGLLFAYKVRLTLTVRCHTFYTQDFLLG